MALGIPALSVGVPNNLTPFVVAGGIAGVYQPSELQPALARLLWDERGADGAGRAGPGVRRIRRGAGRRRGRRPVRGGALRRLLAEAGPVRRLQYGCRAYNGCLGC